MTVTNTTSRWAYTGDGATTVFAYTNLIFAATDLKVYVAGVPQTLTTHYGVSGVGEEGGPPPGAGNVTFVDPPPAGATVLIVRDVPATQAIDYVANDAFPAETHEKGLDKLTVLTQQLASRFARARLLADSDPAASLAALPLKSALAGKFLGFDALGEPIAAAGTSADLGPVSAFIATLLDDADAATARATLGLSAYWRTRLLADLSANVQSLLGASTYAAAADLLIVARDWRGRNALINGGFDFWQRGTSLGAGTGKRWLADRFYNDSVGSTYTAARQAFTLGQTAVPNEPAYFHRTVVTSVAGAGNYANLRQSVEGGRTFAGQSAILSFWAKADAAKPLAVELVQNFGTGGAPSAAVVVGASKVNLTTSWQQFTVALAVPGIAGKTLGSNGDDCLEVRFWFDAGANFNADTATLGQQSGTFDVARAQLEAGAAATPFERRPAAAELALCQRYYQKSYSPAVDPGTATTAGALRCISSGANLAISAQYKRTMRAAPTATAYSPDTGASGKMARVGIADVTPSVNYVSEDSADFYYGSCVDANSYFVHYTADAEL